MADDGGDRGGLTVLVALTVAVLALAGVTAYQHVELTDLRSEVQRLESVADHRHDETGDDIGALRRATQRLDDVDQFLADEMVKILDRVRYLELVLSDF